MISQNTLYSYQSYSVVDTSEQVLLLLPAPSKPEANMLVPVIVIFISFQNCKNGSSAERECLACWGWRNRKTKFDQV